MTEVNAPVTVLIAATSSSTDEEVSISSPREFDEERARAQTDANICKDVEKKQGSGKINAEPLMQTPEAMTTGKKIHPSS